MKKTLILLGFLLVTAFPVLAQNHELTILAGGAKALKSFDGGKSDFQHGFEEISYGIETEQNTFFKIKVGRMDARTVFVGKDSDGNQTADVVDPKGQVEYADATVEYRFAEPFGYTGLFAGAGIYRQSSGSRQDTDYGFVGGVNAIFPISRSVGITAEAAYHWANFYSPKPRYGAIGVGVRFAF